MPEHVSILQLTGAAALALAATAWLVGLIRILRRGRPEAAQGHTGRTLHALPRQRQAAPHLECVELTPAEQDAFAGLVRRLGDGR
ncbi:hypothetical protein [Streptomyces sp. HUAS ZL42]|uniref:hypothetical protein n=1 Tax=Streptomyces sp. HUAS ZL42 TaxID=3231715 RepID=UPI00345EFEFA